MAKKYHVRLMEEEQQELRSLVSKGRAAAYMQSHARILLLSDENPAEGAMSDQEIGRALKMGDATMERVRRRGVEEGPEAAMERRQQVNRRTKKLDGQAGALLIVLACSQPPEYRASWALQVMAGQLVKREIVESISAETVRRTLKKPNQALAERVLMHPHLRAVPFRVCHGGCAGGLSL